MPDGSPRQWEVYEMNEIYDYDPESDVLEVHFGEKPDSPFAVTHLETPPPDVLKLVTVAA